MRNKRLFLGLVIGVAVFAASFGMAASLGGINTNTLGADDAIVAACDTTGGITATYTTIFSSGYKVDKVTLGSLDAACLNKPFKVTLTGGTAQEVTGTLPASGTSYDVEFPDTKLAEEVTGIHVVISGTP
ncbi:MAG: hypothetical protein M3161_03465 [Actinomycetota bacterium]|nr:hypothetical protein [Actinomycetota bacterium]